MRYHFGDTGKVCHHKAVEAPLLAQYVGHQPFIGRGWYAVYFIERCHNAAYTCIHGSLVGIHVFVEHTVTAHVYGIVITSGFSGTIQCEVLYTCHNFIVALQLVVEVDTLITRYHCFSDGSTQEWVFAVTLADASPARITADVYHRAECPGNTISTGLDGCNAGRFPDGFHIPGTGEA